MRETSATDRAINIRRAAARADAMRSIMPLASLEDALETILNRQNIKAADRREVKR